MNKEKNLVLILLLIMLSAQCLAVIDVNMDGLSSTAKASKRNIDNADAAVRNMALGGLPRTRAKDTVLIAENLFEIATQNERGGKGIDYKAVNEKALEAIELSEKAFQISDELALLKETIDSLEEEIDWGQATALYELGVDELENQRYELALVKIDETYDKILELQSIEARTSAMYDAASKNITNFLIENRVLLSLIIGIPIILYVIFKSRIRRYFLKKKIKRLELEINVVSDQIKKAQKEYFETGTLAESTYQVRGEIYGETVRSLNREISVTREEIEKTKKGKLMRLKKAFKIGENK